MSGRPSIQLIGSRLRGIRARNIVTVAAIGLGLIGFTAFSSPPPWLVWNASESAPVGLYRIGRDAPARGDLVLIRTPESIANLVEKRGYLPRGVPLVKRVAAMPGVHVCAFYDVIIIGGNIVAHRVSTDRNGSPLPWWDGCRELETGEVFLLNGDAPESFDSRYFGPVAVKNIIGRLVPLWTG